jgi:pyruvate dehydrogenase E2 component (dihydrolipoamide acetyltransferase)
MATPVILPALGMAQETGRIVRWLKAEGEQVTQGEPLVEIETDKATVELEAPASGFLSAITAAENDEVPVGNVIAEIRSVADMTNQQANVMPQSSHQGKQAEREERVQASPLAARIAAEHQLDLSQITPAGKRIQKADVLTYLQTRAAMAEQQNGVATVERVIGTTLPRLVMASPKARRLAREAGKDLAAIKGSGPDGAVLSGDVLAALAAPPMPAVNAMSAPPAPAVAEAKSEIGDEGLTVGNIWRIMAERTTQSWTSVPHFALVREVDAQRLIAWREYVCSHLTASVTYTDLLVKLVAAALRAHSRLNASWQNGVLRQHDAVNIGIAVAVDEGLIVPVIHHADAASISEIARRRADLVTRAQMGKIRPEDLTGGTFTISNLGMYGVDAFNAIINAPQAAILAVGRIAERVVPVEGQPAVRPMMVLTLSCDHRVVDGARAARFLNSLATLIEEPLALFS